jgi:hypothetical protein
MALIFKGAVTDFAAPVEEYRSCQRIAGFGFI